MEKTNIRIENSIKVLSGLLDLRRSSIDLVPKEPVNKEVLTDSWLNLLYKQPGNLILIPANVSLIRFDDDNISIKQTITTNKPVDAILLEKFGERCHRIYYQDAFWVAQDEDIYTANY